MSIWLKIEISIIITQESPGFDADIYDRLAEALKEAQIAKKEAYEESIKRRRIEQDMISTLQKVSICSRCP